MNAIILDPTGWVSVSMAAKLKGIPVSTLHTRIEEDNIPTKKWGKNRMVRLIDIDEAIDKADVTAPEQRGGERVQDRPRQVATPPLGRQKALYRPNLQD